MHRRRIAIVAGVGLIVLLGLTALPRAEGFEAGILWDVCHERTSELWVKQNQFVCASYIRGAIDGIRIQAYQPLPEDERKPEYLPFCFPTGSKMDDVIALVLRYIEAKPSIRSQSGSLAIHEALSTNWPCLR